MHIAKKIKLVAALLLVVLVLGCGAESKKLLPNTIGSFELVHSIKGKEAERLVINMHNGAKMVLKKTEIGDYYAGNYQAKLWIGKAKSEKSAKILNKRMTKKISKGKSPYGKPENAFIKDKKITKMESDGQKHYFYVAKDKVVWLSVDNNLADKTISKLISIVN